MRITSTGPVLYPIFPASRGVAVAGPVRAVQEVDGFVRSDTYRVVEGEVLERCAQQAYANVCPPYRVVEGTSSHDSEPALSRLSGAAIVYTAHGDLNQLLGQPKGVVVDAFV